MNSDRVVSISAMIVAVGTLFVIIYQTHLTRKAQQASVLPYLQIGYSRSEGYSYINLVNHGIGPALIEDIRVIKEGSSYPGDPVAFFSQLNEDLDSNEGLYIDRVFQGMLIPAGASKAMIGVRRSSEEAMRLERVFNVTGIGEEEGEPEKAIIVITYASVYGKRWVIHSNEIVPKPS